MLNYMTKIKESLSELDENLKLVRQHFLFNDQIFTQILMSLNQDAINHSDKLEPDCDHKTTLNNLNSALDHVVEDFKDNDSFESKFNLGFILNIAGIIHPLNYGFRSSTAYIRGQKDLYLLMNPAKITRELEKIVNHLNFNNEKHVALKAAEFHLYFAIIHPFSDGNGRTARFLHNLYLYDKKYPPATIWNTERNTYLNHIEDAIIGFRRRNGQEDMFNNQSYEEYRFFEYMVEKIKYNTQVLEQKISNLKKYEIDLRFQKYVKVGKGKLKDCLQRTLKAQNYTVQVCFQKEDNLIITTAAPEEMLIGFFEKYRDNNINFKGYKIKSL